VAQAATAQGCGDAAPLGATDRNPVRPGVEHFEDGLWQAADQLRQPPGLGSRCDGGPANQT